MADNTWDASPLQGQPGAPDAQSPGYNGYDQRPYAGQSFSAQGSYGAGPYGPYGAPVGTPGAYPPPPVYAAVPPAPAPARKSRGWIVAVVAIIAVCVLCVASLNACSSMLSAPFSSLDSGEGTGLESVTGDAVAVITISGTIQYDGSECSPEGLKYLLDEAEANDHVKAVVLRVDSGGGTATAGEEMTEYLSAFSKPVVVSSASMNASAAYEFSSQADYIFVGKTTMIGSIGTVLEMMDYSGLLEKLGISSETIASSGSKDSTYGTRPLTEEERAYYQKMVNQINEAFIENVASGRSMPIDEVRALATGLTFTGIDAVSNGLADEIGTLEDACAKAAELGGTSRYTVVDMTLASGYGDVLSLLGYNVQDSLASGASNEGRDSYGLYLK